VGGLIRRQAPYLNDALTTVERNHVEHWGRRRWQILRASVLSGSLLWAGIVAFTAVSDLHEEGRLDAAAGAVLLGIGLIGGGFFGALMWSFGEIRFRRFRKKRTQDGI
jgi:hypothetical protein